MANAATPRRLGAFLLLAALAMPTVAYAEQGEQDTIPSGDSAFSGDYVTIGIGGIVDSDYEGSDDYDVSPAGGFRGRVGGIRFFSRAVGIGLDFIPDKDGSDIRFTAGPVVRLKSNRSGKVKDEIVRLLPRLGKTVEAGVTLGVSFDEVISKKDSLSFGTDIRWAVHNNKGGRIITPNVGYSMPLSPAMGIGLSFGMDHVNGKYADYNYNVDPAGAAASGLPLYDAKGGFKNWSTQAYMAYDLDGDLRNGGWAIGATVGYSRLIGSAAKTPITALRGNRNQFSGGIGIGYTF